MSTPEVTDSVTETLSTIASASTSIIETILSSSELPSTTSTSAATTTSSRPARTTSEAAEGQAGFAQQASGISLVAFVTALAASLIVFGVQMGFFLLLRNKLVRIFKPKTYLVPERERTEPPPASHFALLYKLMAFRDREIIKKCGLDAYFFLRYLQTLLIIFIPIALVVIPILVPINFVGGIGQEVVDDLKDENGKPINGSDLNRPTGLDTLAWGNVAPSKQHRRWAHLVLALLVIIWVCGVFFAELRVYVKIRQDYLTSAEHRLRASANTVLVSSIPDKWLSEEALRGLFDVFPGGIRNVWLTRDFTPLLAKIHKRDAIHKQLEAAESDLIREAKRKQLRQAKEGGLRERFTSEGRANKAQRAEQAKAQNLEAQRRAEGPGGLSANTPRVPHSVQEEVVENEKKPEGDLADVQEEGSDVIEMDNLRGNPLSKIGHGLGRGLGKGAAAVSGAGLGILGGAKAVGKGIDSELERSGGFTMLNSPEKRAPSPDNSPTTDASSPRRAQITVDEDDKPRTSYASERPLTQSTRHQHTASNVSNESDLRHDDFNPRSLGNTTRKATNMDEMVVTKKTYWFQFWKPPTGSYASPIPQGYEGGEYPWTKAEKKSFWEKFKSSLPWVEDESDPVEYPQAYTYDYRTHPEDGAEWKKWLKPKDRPQHRVAIFEWTPSWLPGLPLINKKVDTIYWCREQLAQLNMEIEEDQQHPERYPVMNSAFIQFNHQVAAHMACQSVTHHVPKHMAPRMVEISPDDVIWDNMAIMWWSAWLRRAVVFLIVAGMIILWAIPVAWTASLSQIDALIEKFPWLEFIEKSDTLLNVVKAVAGVLPAIVLAIILALIPTVLDLLAGFQGEKTGSFKSETVQIYYFAFLFTQVFLVVSIAAGTFQVLEDLGKDFQKTPDILAKNIPKAANYFFSYMILQALSTSSGTLLQIGTLVVWYFWARIVDNTARAKWTRNTQLPSINWGSFFPVYTNFACIALIYSIAAPIISIFAIITFSLLWVAHRYNMLYVTRFKTDTGGVLYPRAINQTFTGLYVMELCLVGLFSLARDEDDNAACLPQALIMVVTIFLTALYQYILNASFGPLFRYLPITFEDEAVLRDEAFRRAQERRLGLYNDDDEATHLNGANGTGEDIELEKIGQHKRSHSRTGSVMSKMSHAGQWAARGGKQIRRATGKTNDALRTAADYRKQKRQKDLEAQRAMGDALYGGYCDAVEDLTAEERDALVRKAFQHSALRARRPIVWIPRDDLGVSDDEIGRTNEFSRYISITNEGTALDSEVRVVYGKNPPDFSDVDLINL
ncbi:hypothetical protein B0T21DRAFT_412317 [Apiosordaria backusii]|uniref:DUF221-domain-containing protein n=1 Tax=Apiosordaria backusii TaxID=314023 RepID=A0AA40BK54_9PEZI|nr:hypothetical protein B0T21DRAFT_412317 [Apiosordaria backusii]